MTHKETDPAAATNLHIGWKFLAAAELLTAVFLLEFSIWTADPQVRLVSGILAGCMVFRCLFCYGRRPDFVKATAALSTTTILLATLGLGLVLAVAFFLLDLWSPSLVSLSERTVTDWWMVKVPTVILQQVLFQLVFIPTLLFLTGNRTLTVTLAALIFSFFHLPNPLLVILTLSIGLFWFSQAISRPRLITLTVSHLVLAVVLATVGEEYVFDMRVGQICFQKWPAVIESEADDKSLVVYPRPLPGEIYKVSQKGTQVQFCGKVFDPIRSKAPHSIFLVLGSYDPLDTIGRSWVPQKILRVDQIEPGGEFELDIESARVGGALEIRMFAQHKFGWSYPVNGSARIQVAANDTSGEQVCLYPKQIHGNVGHIKQRKNRTDLIGWAFTRPYHDYVESLLVYHGGELVKVPIERRKRLEIAEYFEDDRLVDCGFISRVPFTIDSSHVNVYVRNAEGELERVPIELASGSTQVAGKNVPLR